MGCSCCYRRDAALRLCPHIFLYFSVRSLVAFSLHGMSLETFEHNSADEATKGLAPEVIGQAVSRALTSQRPKVRTAIVPQRFKKLDNPSANSDAHARQTRRPVFLE